jgi:hypothetical protein
MDRKTKPATRPRHSFSELAYYLECPMRYKFAVVYALEAPWLDPVDFGANVHRCLEAIHQKALHGEMTAPADLPELVAENWRSTPRSQPEMGKRQSKGKAVKTGAQKDFEAASFKFRGMYPRSCFPPTIDRQPRRPRSNHSTQHRAAS